MIAIYKNKKRRLLRDSRLTLEMFSMKETSLHASIGREENVCVEY